MIDIAVGADLSVLVMAATRRHVRPPEERGVWEKTEMEGTGGSDWVGVEVSEQGKMWGYAYYPGTSSAMTAFIQEGVATSGLLTDIDGDGWSRLDEVRCGTDYASSSSTPADTDGDGVCDLFDDWEDTSVSPESDALAIGEEFGCAVLSEPFRCMLGRQLRGTAWQPLCGIEQRLCGHGRPADRFRSRGSRCWVRPRLLDRAGWEAGLLGQEHGRAAWSWNILIQRGPGYVTLPSG